MTKVTLSEYCIKNNISYYEGYRRFKDGILGKMENGYIMIHDNNNDDVIQQELIYLSKKFTNPVDFAFFILENYNILWVNQDILVKAHNNSDICEVFVNSCSSFTNLLHCVLYILCNYGFEKKTSSKINEDLKINGFDIKNLNVSELVKFYKDLKTDIDFFPLDFFEIKQAFDAKLLNREKLKEIKQKIIDWYNKEKMASLEPINMSSI